MTVAIDLCAHVFVQLPKSHCSRALKISPDICQNVYYALTATTSVHSHLQDRHTAIQIYSYILHTSNGLILIA